MTLRGKPSAVLHRDRTHRYLHIRFGLPPHIPTTWQFMLSPVAARKRGALLRAKPRNPAERPWELRTDDLVDQLAVDPFAIEAAVVADALGQTTDTVTELLYNPDWISESVDALRRTVHELQIRDETACLLAGGSDDVLQQRRQAVARRLKEVLTLADSRRKAALAETVSTPTAPDPDRIAASWVGRYLPDERKALFDRHAEAAGTSLVLTGRNAFLTRVRDLLHTGQLRAPVTEEVTRLLGAPPDTLREAVLRDALQNSNRLDALSHPLLLESWQRKLEFLRTVTAKPARNQRTDRLTPLDADAPARLPVGAADELAGHRQVFARLVECSQECERLRLALKDAVALAESADPARTAVHRVVEAAEAELCQRHPGLFVIARAFLYPHQDDSGRLGAPWPEQQADTRRTALLAMARYTQTPTSTRIRLDPLPLHG
ncbi:hypothetical protein [Kitasatospora sp. NPDC098663]|uniref:hypothetical protein n=1 Tax=Kitasatospora sp. NPDC098663 TaxID=3364096 RepID=UPI0038025304